MRFPLPSRLRIVFWPLTALTFAGAIRFVGQGTLTTAVTPWGLVDLEFASTQERVNQVIAAWDVKQVRQDAIRITYLDILFIALYASSVSLSTRAAAGPLQAYNSPLAWLGSVLSWGQLGTAVSGAGENLGMLWQLYRAPNVTGWWARITWACAWCKWALVVSGVLYSLYGAVAWITVGGTLGKHLEA